MNLLKDFKSLTKFELVLWSVSMCVVSASFLMTPNKDVLSLIASLIGVTALIFLAKGMIVGQIFTIVFSVFYAIISFLFRYYGEMITYLFMSMPMAICAAWEWYKNPYKNTKEVKIKEITFADILKITVLGIVVTWVFYYILKVFNTANLVISTISIITSFIAAYLTFLRSPYYAIAYSINDIVLIVMWIMASFTDSSYVPMIFCFVMFLFNDIYGFVNWEKMRKKQKEDIM